MGVNDPSHDIALNVAGAGCVDLTLMSTFVFFSYTGTVRITSSTNGASDASYSSSSVDSYTSVYGSLPTQVNVVSYNPVLPKCTRNLCKTSMPLTSELDFSPCTCVGYIVGKST